MRQSSQDTKAAFERQVSGEEGQGDAVAEREHETIFVACGWCAGEEWAGVQWERTDEGATFGWGNVRVESFVEVHHGEGHEGEEAGADADASCAAELGKALGWALRELEVEDGGGEGWGFGVVQDEGVFGLAWWRRLGIGGAKRVWEGCWRRVAFVSEDAGDGPEPALAGEAAVDGLVQGFLGWWEARCRGCVAEQSCLVVELLISLVEEIDKGVHPIE